MGVLIGLGIVGFVGLVLITRYIAILMEDNHSLQIENTKLLEELVALKQYNIKHKKQQLND
jgi:regulator of replication initiation timing